MTKNTPLSKKTLLYFGAGGFGISTVTSIAVGAMHASLPSHPIIYYGMTTLIASCCAFFVSALLARPLTLAAAHIGTFLHSLSSQQHIDLSARYNGPAYGENIGAKYNAFVNRISAAIQSADGHARTLCSNTASMNQETEGMTNSVEEISGQITMVASVTEMTHSSIRSISSAADDLSNRSKSVAVSVEEMSATIAEIARNCQNEASMVATASQQTTATQRIMIDLSKASKEIGSIMDVILSISDQTKLLALNAAIEAASAGDAGKGFAVVAAEVKNLAQQTSQATDSIRSLIESMQKNTAIALESMTGVNAIMDEVSGVSRAIATAVEQQSATTLEISRNVAETSSRASEIAQNVNESTSALSEVAATIGSLNDATAHTCAAAMQTHQLAGTINSAGTELLGIIDQFKTG